MHTVPILGPSSSLRLASLGPLVRRAGIWLLLLLLLLCRFSHVRFCSTPEMAAQQALPSLGFSRQEHLSGFSWTSSQFLQPQVKENSCRESGISSLVRTLYGG